MNARIPRVQWFNAATWNDQRGQSPPRSKPRDISPLPGHRCSILPAVARCIRNVVFLVLMFCWHPTTATGQVLQVSSPQVTTVTNTYVCIDWTVANSSGQGATHVVFYWDSQGAGPGTWHPGSLQSGHYEQVWHDGWYENTTWHDGYWTNGDWHDGYYEQVWHDGGYENGTWHDGWWENTTWHDGYTDEDNVWHDGYYDQVWHDGYYDQVWHDGYYDQVWHDGYYEQVWHDGYYDQVWHDGYYDQVWHDTCWQNGYWDSSGNLSAAFASSDPGNGTVVTSLPCLRSSHTYNYFVKSVITSSTSNPGDPNNDTRTTRPPLRAEVPATSSSPPDLISPTGCPAT